MLGIGVLSHKDMNGLSPRRVACSLQLFRDMRWSVALELPRLSPELPSREFSSN